MQSKKQKRKPLENSRQLPINNPMIPPQKHRLPLPPPRAPPAMIAIPLQIRHRHFPPSLGPAPINIHHVDDIGLGLEADVDELEVGEGGEGVAETGEDEVEGCLGDAGVVGVGGNVVAGVEGESCGVEWGGGWREGKG